MNKTSVKPNRYWDFHLLSNAIHTIIKSYIELAHNDLDRDLRREYVKAAFRSLCENGTMPYLHRNLYFYLMKRDVTDLVREYVERGETDLDRDLRREDLKEAFMYFLQTGKIPPVRVRELFKNQLN